MEIKEFEDMIDDLFVFFGKDTKPTDKQIEMWFEKIRDISSTAIQFIQTWIEDNNKSLSRQTNMPKLIWRAFYEWRRSNPDHATSHQKTPCAECGGKGLLWYKTTDELGQIIDTYGRCSQCENWKRHFNDQKAAGPAVSRALFEHYGFELAGPTRTPERFDTPDQSIADMSGQIGERI